MIIDWHIYKSSKVLFSLSSCKRYSFFLLSSRKRYFFLIFTRKMSYLHTEEILWVFLFLLCSPFSCSHISHPSTGEDYYHSFTPSHPTWTREAKMLAWEKIDSLSMIHVGSQHKTQDPTNHSTWSRFVFQATQSLARGEYLPTTPWRNIHTPLYEGGHTPLYEGILACP